MDDLERAARAWASIGEARCINLVHRSDRKAVAQSNFTKAGVLVEFYAAEKRADGDGVRGCYESHLACYKEALAKGLKHLVVFEDDATPSSHYTAAAIEELADILKDMAQSEWDLLFFGCQPGANKWRKKASFANGRPVFKVNAWNTHAYIISESFMRIMVAKPITKAIDAEFVTSHSAYARLPCLFIQGRSASDITSSQASEQIVRDLINRAVEYHAALFPWPFLTTVFVAVMLIILMGAYVHGSRDVVALRRYMSLRNKSRVA